MDQKDIENGDNSPPGEVSCSPKPGEVKSTSNNSTTETEKLQTPAKLASPAANPGQNFESLYNETKNRFLEYTVNAESRFTKLQWQYDKLLKEIDKCSDETSSREKNLAAEVAAIKKENDELKIRISEDRAMYEKQTICKPGQCQSCHRKKGSCTPEKCDEDDDKYKLECDACNKLFHYCCTGLPLYQISKFLIKGYRKFVCWNCAKIPEYIREALASQQPEPMEHKVMSTTGVQTLPGMAENLDTLTKDNETLTKSLHNTRGELSKTSAQLTEALEENKDAKNQISSLHNNENVLRGLLNEREEELDRVQTILNTVEQRSIAVDSGTASEDRGTLIEEKNELEERLKKKDDDLTRVTDEKTKYQKERLQLSQKVSALEKESAGMEIRLKSQGDMIQHLRNKTSIADVNMETTKKNCPATSATDSSIEKKFEEFTTNLLTKVTQIVDEKLNNLAPISGEEKLSWADRASGEQNPPVDFATVMRKTKNDELVQEQERQRRNNNIIIHGMSEELKDTTVPLKSQDDYFITSLMEILGVDKVPTSIVRLGKPGPGKNRPVKLTMKCVEDKEQVMSNLKKLKDADPEFHRLSIRDDYTMEERDLIKKFAEDAKKKNKEENTTAWKVRGTPKNGLHLVKITKR